MGYTIHISFFCLVNLEVGSSKIWKFQDTVKDVLSTNKFAYPHTENSGHHLVRLFDMNYSVARTMGDNLVINRLLKKQNKTKQNKNKKRTKEQNRKNKTKQETKQNKTKQNKNIKH